MRRLVVRADASARVGVGHVMRCLALAQEWLGRGGPATFVTCCDNDDLRARIARAGARVVPLDRPYPDVSDLRITTSVAREGGTGESAEPWLVLDGYHFDEQYHRGARAGRQRTMVVDDMAHLTAYEADIVLNPSTLEGLRSYSAPEGTRFLLGPRFALLRDEFAARRHRVLRVPPVARRVLITMGGGDPDGVTATVLRALTRVRVDGLEVIAVLGASNPHADDLASLAARLDREQPDRSRTIRVERDVDDMSRLMAWADVAVTAAGGTVWEAACLGLPCILVVLAANQEVVAEVAERERIGVSLGRASGLDEERIADAIRHLCFDRPARVRLASAGRRLVDGRGCARVVDEMLASGREGADR
jgi:UDP-2,4-diacetamido-2,4,6-trideoxy-beta-L-altropyranose hydrolase